MSSSRCAIIGAGPAGLTAAYELLRQGRDAVVYERSGEVGGISRTVVHHGNRFDIGGHRFFTKVPQVQQIWDELLGDELLDRQRLSRILYRGRFFDYPLRPLNALSGLGPAETLRVVASYARARLFPGREERNFEQWVVNRFGRRLYEIFFKTYTEKVWGIPCTEIGADWASQRIKNLDLSRAIWSAFRGQGRTRDGEVITTLIDRFRYPRRGPGMMWERCRDVLAGRGVPTHLRQEVVAIHHREGRVVEVELRGAEGPPRRVEVDSVLSSMPIRSLIRRLRPEPPAAVREAAEGLRYRDFLTVALIIDRPEVFPDNWVYVHSPQVRLGRIQNYKNWSPEMVADPGHTTLGLEYFVSAGDDLWEMPDPALIALGTRECEALDLLRGAKVLDAAVVREPLAYPVYDGAYSRNLEVLRDYLAGLPNLQQIGRNGQHRYNNQDHSMMTGVLAAQNLMGAQHDIWAVNTEDEYHEEQRTDAPLPRSTPRSVRG